MGWSKPEMVAAQDALPGRSQAMPVSGMHAALGTPLVGPFPEGLATAYFALGCFWGAERVFLSAPVSSRRLLATREALRRIRATRKSAQAARVTPNR